jgi:hydroxypyruvate isomerase
MATTWQHTPTCSVHSEQAHNGIGHFHTAGNPGRNELDESQELYYPAVMRAIAATDYDGYVGQELMPKGEPFAALGAAYRASDV